MHQTGLITFACSVILVIVIVAVFSQSAYSGVRFPTKASTDDSSIGLTFSVELNTTQFQQGQAVNITAYVTNNRSDFHNLTASTNWTEQWLIGWANIASCESFANAQVIQGYYVQSNVSSAGTKGLDLAKLVGREPCYSHYGEAWYYYFPFQAHELRIGYQFTAKGYFPPKVNSSGFQGFQFFPPGEYTVAAGDEWGQFLILHFKVLSPP